MRCPVPSLVLLALAMAALAAPAEASLGNLREQALGTRTIAVNYTAATNRVSSAVDNGVTKTYGYDARGTSEPVSRRLRNRSSGPISGEEGRGSGTTGVGAFTFTYDFANQPTAVSGGATATYAYDGNLKRVKDFGAGCARAQEIGPVDRFQAEKAAAAACGGKTVYTVFSKVTGGLLYRDQATDVIKTDYVTVGGAALRLKKTGTGAPVPEYTHFDSQGSAVAATNAAGTITWRERVRAAAAAFFACNRSTGSISRASRDRLRRARARPSRRQQRQHGVHRSA